MSPQSRKRALYLLTCSIVLTAVIAAGLPGLAFRPGLPPPSFEKGQVSVPVREQGPVGVSMGRFAAILVLIVLGVSFLVLVIRAARGIPWKKLLAGLWSLLWKLILAVGIVLMVVSVLPRSARSAPGVPLPEPKPLVTAPLGAVPLGLIWAAGIALAAVVVLLVLRALLARRPPPARSWEVELSRARQELMEGGDPRDVIIRCYTRMSEALQEERGIERELSMTTGEFQVLLAEQGLPPPPVRQLTRLFDAARYSLGTPVPGGAREAIACLDAILDSSRRTAPGGTAP